MYDIVIIGGGPAGLTAALYATRAGRSALLLEGGVLGGQAATTPEIENWPGTQRISGGDFAMNLYQQSTALGAEIRFEAATGLEKVSDGWRVRTAAGGYETRAVILANGVRRRKLGVPGEEQLAGRGVSVCATCDGGFFKGKEVAVVGGGSAALEDALYLASLCPRVWLIHRRDRFRGETHLVRAVESIPNIIPVMDTWVEEVRGAERVESLLLDGKAGARELTVSAVFTAVGLIPDNGAFAPPLELDEQGYVRADEGCRTNLPGVFAAGDTRAKPLRQLVTAAADGAMAAFQAGNFLNLRDS